MVNGRAWSRSLSTGSVLVPSSYLLLVVMPFVASSDALVTSSTARSH